MDFAQIRERCYGECYQAIEIINEMENRTIKPITPNNLSIVQSQSQNPRIVLISKDKCKIVYFCTYTNAWVDENSLPVRMMHEYTCFVDLNSLDF